MIYRKINHQNRNIRRADARNSARLAERAGTHLVQLFPGLQAQTVDVQLVNVFGQQLVFELFRPRYLLAALLQIALVLYFDLRALPNRLAGPG